MEKRILHILFYRILLICIIIPTFFLTVTSCKTNKIKSNSKNEQNYKEWETYLGDKASTQYSSLDQINRSNVSDLKVAWTYHTKDKTKRSTIETNPIIIGDVMYITSPGLHKVIALNASNGKEIWAFKPEGPKQANRGVTYWSEGNDERILFTKGHYIYALNAKTGKPIESFGANSKVNLRRGLDRGDIEKASISATSPGIIYKNLIIFGSRVGEGPGSSPGHIRAYDVRTGRQVWNFHNIPHPGEYGYNTWSKKSWKLSGGANDWAGMSLDEERGIVFATTGSPSYQFYGGNRKGNNLFATSVIALNAYSGKRIWHFQTVRHDLWDYDNPQPPNLVTVKHNNSYVDAVVQVTKTGVIFVLDRTTGESLFPVEERPVPESGLPGEKVAKTQPIPVKPPPFVRHGLTKDDLTNLSKEKNQWARKQFDMYGSQGIFTPPRKNPGTIISPGFHGGGWWGGSAFDPATGILYVNGNNIPYILSMRRPAGSDHQTKSSSLGKEVYAISCSTCHGNDRKGSLPAIPGLLNIKNRLSRTEASKIIEEGRGGMPSFSSLSEKKKDAILAFLFNEERKQNNNNLEEAPPHLEEEMPLFIHDKYTQFRDPEGYPAVKPPWGTLNAIDLNEGKILWQVPLGEYKELTKKGIPPTGTENLGGPVVTAGGLIFIGASRDHKFRAFDKKTGKILWETTLEHSVFSTPSIYEIDGKEYIVVATGGVCLYCSEGNHKQIADEEPGDSFVVFTLP